MNRNQQLPNKVMVLSIFLAAVPSKCVFNAAGLPNFPEPRFSHYLILFCYAFGSISIAKMWVVPALLRIFAWLGKPETPGPEGDGPGKKN